MPLSNEQYNQIMHIYDERQLFRQRELERRRRTLFAKVPRIREIEDEIRRKAIAEVERRLAAGAVEGSDDRLNKDSTDKDGRELTHETTNKTAGRINKLSSERTALMRDSGLGEDYLEVPYTCPDCQDTGFVDGRRCHCFVQLSLELLYDSHTDQLAELSFDDFSLDYYSDTFIDERTGRSAHELAGQALRQARLFVSDFDDSFDNLLLMGRTGTGKTHLSGCIGNELRQTGHTVVYLTAFELFSIMKQEAFSRERTRAGEFTRMFSCDLLIVDDLGTEFANTMTNSQLFELVNERIRRRASTLISTNLDFEGLSASYTERLVSRFVEYYTALTLVGADIRMLKRGIR